MKNGHKWHIYALAFTVSLAACNQSKNSAQQTDSTSGRTEEDVAIEPTIPLTTPDGEPARFAFRSGIVEMEYQGDYRGIRRTTFTDYGVRERRHDSAVPANKHMTAIPPQQLAIMTPTVHGVIDLRDKTGQKMPNNAYQKYRESWRTTSRPFGEIALEHSGGKRLPDTVLQGNYACRVYQQKGQTFTRTIWVWGGLPIREELVLTNGQAGSFLLEPVSIKTDIVVLDSLFTFPAGYEIEEVLYGSGR
ncbi:MAG: hypothetical protein J4G05_10310 [Chlorobi bacterium]|nr:hypothetical protein [Chlorobiota bacterium]